MLYPGKEMIYANKIRDRIKANKSKKLAQKMPKLTISAYASIATGDAEKTTRTLSILAYTGGQLCVDEFDLPVVIDLSKLTVKASVPILYNHDTGDVLAQSKPDLITNTGKELKISATYFLATSRQKEVANMSDSGYQWQASVGCHVNQLERINAGKIVDVNGQSFEGPIYVARAAELYECSVLAIGADSNTKALVATFNKDFSMTFEQWIQQCGLDINALDDSAKSALMQAYNAIQSSNNDNTGGDGNVTAGSEGSDDKNKEDEKEKNMPAGAKMGLQAAPQVDVSKLVAAAVSTQVEQLKVSLREEMLRDEKINSLTTSHPELRAKAISEKWSIDKTELEVLRASRVSPVRATSFNSTLSQEEQSKVRECSILLATHSRENFLIKSYGDKIVNEAGRKENLQCGIQQLFKEALHANGHNPGYGRLSDREILTVLQIERSGRLQASQGFSMTSISETLSNVANKALLDVFENNESVVPKIAKEEDTNDFKPYFRIRVTGTGTFQEVGADGELKHITLRDDKITNQVNTYGNMIALTRQMIINDDLGAFTDLPKILATNGLLARDELVFTTLLGNSGSFFHSNNSNYASGGVSALSFTSLTNAKKLFRQQKNLNNKPVMIRPRTLLVPPALEDTALQLINSELIVTGSDTTKGNANTFKNAYEIVTAEYLSTVFGLTNSSDTGWYLLAEPNDNAVIRVGYLKGQRQPTIEFADTEFSTLGMQWRGYWDFGVALGEKRGGVLSVGA